MEGRFWAGAAIVPSGYVRSIRRQRVEFGSELYMAVHTQRSPPFQENGCNDVDAASQIMEFEKRLKCAEKYPKGTVKRSLHCHVRISPNSVL